MVSCGNWALANIKGIVHSMFAKTLYLIPEKEGDSRDGLPLYIFGN